MIQITFSYLVMMIVYLICEYLSYLHRQFAKLFYRQFSSNSNFGILIYNKFIINKDVYIFAKINSKIIYLTVYIMIY